ncbi:MAG: M42 family metallopeptidase [Erysipelotrichaceae bacterium]
MDIALAKELTQAVGISGCEKYVSRILKKYYDVLTDEVVYDNLGGICAIKRCGKENAKKVLVVAHMDEVGMIVSDICDNGCLKFEIIGGIWNQNMLAQRVLLQNSDGKIFKGCIGSIAPHLLSEEVRNKPMDPKNMYIDLGFTCKQEVIDAGIRHNDPMVMDGPFEELNNGQRILAKAFDDRYGCILGVELLRAVKDIQLDFDLYVAGSVQEEVGLRGASTMTHLVNPDLAIVLDCSPANDYSTDKNIFGVLGKGVLVRFFDRGMLPNRTLINWYQDLMDKANIKNQYYVSMGGTDAGVIHKSNDGIPTLTMCLCARNIHCSASIIDMNDYKCAYDALLLVMRELNGNLIEDFKRENQ